PARDGLLGGGAPFSGRGGPASPDLLVRPQAGPTAPALTDRGAPKRAAGRPDDAPARRLRAVPGGSRPSPPGPQPAPGLETVAAACGSRRTARADNVGFGR